MVSKRHYWGDVEVWPWPRRKRLLPPASITVSSVGRYGTPTSCEVASQGGHRVANDIAGYNVYVGVDALPDLTGDPTQFSATLPFNVNVVAPLSGERTFYVVVRRQNQYGLESQNQYAKTITIDSAGLLVLPPLLAPAGLRLIPLPGGYVRVQSTYPNFTADEYPANEWRVWVGSSAPSTGGAPSLTATASTMLSGTLGSYSPGTYHVAVALRRNADAFLSPELRGTFTIPDAPTVPLPVLSGDQI